MILVELEREVGDDLLEGTLWQGTAYVSGSDDPETAANAAIAAWQKEYGGVATWLARLFPYDTRMRVRAYRIEPDALLGAPVYYDEDVDPRSEYEEAAQSQDACAFCGSSLETLRPCPSCGQMLCQDCEPPLGAHVCEV